MDVDVWVIGLDDARRRTAREAIVAAHPDRRSSFSDSGRLAVLAVARDGGAIGADVEQVRERARLNAVAARVFGSHEARAIAAARGPDRLSLFYRAWTAVEASAKARGKGLPAMLGARPAQRLPVTWFEPAPGFVAAIAAEDSRPRLHLRELG